MKAIADQLARLYMERGDLLSDRIFCKSRMAEIELELLKDGVEGKNEEIRKLNRANILLNNDEWRALDRIGRDNEAHAIKIDAQIAAYEAQRRAIEWDIRAAIVGYGVRIHADADDFDSVADAAVEQANAFLDARFDTIN